MFVPWDKPRGAVHNLQTALGYGASGANVLVLSDASLYAVQNFAAAELEYATRWADEILENGYIPISEESANYGDWIDLINRIQAELTTVSQIDAHMFGWDGAGWRESPRPFGTQYVLRQSFGDPNLSGGSQVLEMFGIAGDKRAVITNIVASYIGTVPGVIVFYVRQDSTDFPFQIIYAPVSGTLYPWQGELVMTAGDKLMVGLFNATANDDFNFWALGYQFDE